MKNYFYTESSTKYYYVLYFNTCSNDVLFGVIVGFTNKWVKGSLSLYLSSPRSQVNIRKVLKWKITVFIRI